MSLASRQQNQDGFGSYLRVQTNRWCHHPCYAHSLDRVGLDPLDSQTPIRPTDNSVDSLSRLSGSHDHSLRADPGPNLQLETREVLLQSLAHERYGDLFVNFILSVPVCLEGEGPHSLASVQHRNFSNCPVFRRGLVIDGLSCRSHSGEFQSTFRSNSVDAEAQALDGARAEAPGGVARAVVIGLHQHAVHLYVAGSHVKPRRQSI